MGELSQLNPIQVLDRRNKNIRKLWANLDRHRYSKYRISSRPPLQHRGPFQLRHVDSDEACPRLLGVLYLRRKLVSLLVSHRVYYVKGCLTNGISKVKRSDIEDVDTIHSCYLLNLPLLEYGCAVL